MNFNIAITKQPKSQQIISQIQQRLKWQEFSRYWHQPKNVCTNSTSEQNNFSNAVFEWFQNTNVLPPVLLFFCPLAMYHTSASHVFWARSYHQGSNEIVFYAVKFRSISHGVQIFLWVKSSKSKTFRSQQYAILT